MTVGERIRAYQQMVDRMRLAGLGLKHHKLDNEALQMFKHCIQQNKMEYKLIPLGNHNH